MQKWVFELEQLVPGQSDLSQGFLKPSQTCHQEVWELSQLAMASLLPKPHIDYTTFVTVYLCTSYIDIQKASLAAVTGLEKSVSPGSLLHVLSNETWRENWQCRKGGTGKEKCFAEWCWSSLSHLMMTKAQQNLIHCEYSVVCVSKYCSDSVNIVFWVFSWWV